MNWERKAKHISHALIKLCFVSGTLFYCELSCVSLTPMSGVTQR